MQQYNQQYQLLYNFHSKYGFMLVSFPDTTTGPTTGDRWTHVGRQLHLPLPLPLLPSALLIIPNKQSNDTKTCLLSVVFVETISLTRGLHSQSVT